MTRRQLLLVLLLGVGVVTWAVVRPGKAAHAGTPTGGPAGCEIASDDYGTNDEEAAGRRWATGQTRHWRYLVVQR